MLDLQPIRIRITYALVALLAALFLGAPGAVAEMATARIAATGDVYQVSFDVPREGTIVVYLPAGIRPGDTVSGRIETAPGSTAKPGYLSEFGLALGKTAHPARDGLGTWKIPDDVKGAAKFALVDASGQRLALVAVPVGPTDTPADGLISGRSGAGVARIPAEVPEGHHAEAADHLELTSHVLAISPRAVVVLDKLAIRTGPQPVTCCSEGGPCGEASCCIFIPSSACTFCNHAGYDACLADLPPD